MRVAVDEQIFAIQPYGGISRLFAELARQYASSVIPDLELLPQDAPIINRYVLDDPLVRDALKAREARNEWTALARYFSRISVKTNCDVVHNTFYLPHGLAPTRGAKRIVTVHDMIPELMPQTRRRLDLLTMKRRYVESADQVICVSEATREDLRKVYGHIKAPVTVVHHGVDPRFRSGVERIGELPTRYVLFVGNRGQYKDADVLFEAFARMNIKDDLMLVCAGGGTFSRDEQQRLQALGIAKQVMHLELNDDAMASAFSNAEIFVFPSRFEGFGLPAIEAMACGTPTILADATSLPEVGSDAAAYFEPGNVAELASTMKELLNNSALRVELSEKGKTRADEFTWRRTAEQTADVYRLAIE